MLWIKKTVDGTTVASSDVDSTFSAINPVTEAHVELESSSVSIISDCPVKITCSKRFDQSTAGTYMLGYVIRLYTDEPTRYVAYLAGHRSLFIGPATDEEIDTSVAMSPVEISNVSATSTKPIEIYLNENNISNIVGA